MAYTATELGRIGTSGGDILLTVNVSPDGATGNITISDVDYAYPIAVIPLIEDPAANAQVAVQALKNSSTNNQIDLKLWQAANSAATAYKKFRLLILCKGSAI